MRIAFDVSPLSHAPRTGVPNYILGSLRGLAAVAADEHEVVPFAPVSLKGKRNLEAVYAGDANNLGSTSPKVRQIVK